MMKVDRKQLPGVYLWLVIAAGALSCAYAAFNLPVHQIDVYFLLLAVLTVVIGSRIAIRIPQINVNITVDDTFIFIGLLMYGLEAAVLLAAIAGVFSGVRISIKVRTVAFAGGALACAVLITAAALKLVFGTTTHLFERGASVAI